MKSRSRSVEGKRSDRAHWLVVALGGALLLAPLAYWLFATGGPVLSYGPSMEPTLSRTELVEVDYEAYDRAAPRLGDVVILQRPATEVEPCAAASAPVGAPCPEPARTYAGDYLIKRIVGIPGDRIAIAPDGGRSATAPSRPSRSSAAARPRRPAGCRARSPSLSRTTSSRATTGGTRWTAAFSVRCPEMRWTGASCCRPLPPLAGWRRGKARCRASRHSDDDRHARRPGLAATSRH